MRRISLIVFMILVIILTACSSKRGDRPQDCFDQYVKLWNKQDFTKMYEMLSSDSKEEFSPDQFIERYSKIYGDLEVSELQVAYEKPSDKMLKAALREGSTTIPFTITMESIAGEIGFEYKATLVQDGKNDKWAISWEPGFIFPQLRDGGKIGLETSVPMRGRILDRDGKPLASNDYIYEVGIVPEKLGNNPEQQKKQIADLLAISVETVDAKLTANWVKPDLFVPIKKLPKGDEDTIARLIDIEGVMTQKVMGRNYPLGEAAAHLIGYVGPISAEELEGKEPGQYARDDLIGKRGLEQLYEKQLRGERGAKIFISKEDGSQEILAEKLLEDGRDLSLTIDIDLQEKLYRAYGDKAGTSAAIDPKTGETLALVSSPAFDPNEFLYGISQDRLKELEEDPRQPIINRFAATFAPGSVIKPITAAIGLKNGIIKPDEGIEIKGLTWSKDKSWGDYKVRRVSESGRPVDLADALIRSDNIYFAMKAVEMGDSLLIDGLKGFGFGEKLPFTYPISESTISSDNTLDDEVQLADTGYGQGEIQMSALHMAASYTSFLNKGNMLKPVLLATEKTEQLWKENLISSDNAKMLDRALRDVVLKGTATVAKKDGLAISGKTGTAELKVSQDSKGSENGWFVGYTTDKEDMLIAMMVEGVEDVGGSVFVAQKLADLLLEFNN